MGIIDFAKPLNQMEEKTGQDCGTTFLGKVCSKVWSKKSIFCVKNVAQESVETGESCIKIFFGDEYLGLEFLHIHFSLYGP